VGALACADVAAAFGFEAVVGGLTWERRPVDPLPGPRAASRRRGRGPTPTPSHQSGGTHMMIPRGLLSRLRGIDLILKPGSCVAIVGETGSGKTTLAKLVVGLYKPWEGKILFDGQTPGELSRRVWTGSVAVVDQDIFVFEDTVRENLSLWNDRLPMEQMVAAARDACLLDEIAARPGHFDTLVTEGGTNWSGGQLQRMEIARALSNCPTILVLDEATSSLDPETEAQIIQNIRHRGCTCLVIAHRLSTIRDMDEIIVLKGGEIIQRGTHAELMSSGGPYVNLVMAE